MYNWLHTKALRKGVLSRGVPGRCNSRMTTAGENVCDVTGMWRKLKALREEKGLFYCAMANDKSTELLRDGDAYSHA